MDVLNLLDQLDDLIYHSKPARFRGQARIDREEAYALLDQIRVSLPEEIKQAEWIVKERRELQREEPGNERLRSVVEAIDESGRPTPPPLTPAAADKVCSIIESAEEVRAEAEREARRIEAEARHRADGVTAEARSRLRRADEFANALMTEASSASAELDGVLDRVRGPAAALADVLSDCATTLEANVARIRAAAAGRDESRTPDLPPPSAGLELDSVSQATEEWSHAELVEAADAAEAPQADDTGEPEVDASLPAADAYIHAERLEGGQEPSEGEQGRSETEQTRG